MSARFSVEAVFKAVDRITAPLQRMRGTVGKFATSMSRGLATVNRTLDGMIHRGMMAGMVLAAGLGAVLFAMRDIIRTGADFEQAITNAAAKFPGSIRPGTVAFEELSEAAREVGRTTEFSAVQSGEALNFLAMAGFNAQDAIRALPSVTDLATAGQLDLATATDIATDTLGAFGLNSADAAKQAENFQRVVDVMAKTSTTTNTTVEQLFEVVKLSGPIARSAGVEIETFSALLGVMANSGVKASQGGTTLRNLFTSLAAPTGAAAAIMKKWNISLDDGAGGAVHITKVLDKLRVNLNKLGKVQRIAVMEEIFGKRSLAGADVLLSATSEQIADLEKQFKNAGGAAKTMADIIRATLGGRLTELESTIEGVKIAISEAIKGPLTAAVVATTAWFRANEKLISSKFKAGVTFLRDNFGQIVKILKFFGVVTGLFLSFIVAVKSATLAVWLLNLAMNANPLGLIITGIAALILLVAAMVIWWDDLRRVFDNLSGAGKVLAVVFLFILGPIGQFILMAGLIIDNWEPISVFLLKMLDGWIAAFDIASHLIGVALDFAGEAAGDFVDFFASTGALGPIKEFFDGFLEPIKQVILGFEKIAELMGTITDSEGFKQFAGIGIDTEAGALSSDELAAQAAAKARMSRPAVIPPQDRQGAGGGQGDATITLRTEGATTSEVTKGSLGASFKLDHSGSD